MCWSYWDVQTLKFNVLHSPCVLERFLCCPAEVYCVNAWFFKICNYFYVRVKVEILHCYLKCLLLVRKSVFIYKKSNNLLLCVLYTTYFKYIWLKNTDLQAVPWIFFSFLLASSLSLSAVLAKLLEPSLAEHFDFTSHLAAWRFFLEMTFSTVEVTSPCLRDLKQLERKQESPSKT